MQDRRSAQIPIYVSVFFPRRQSHFPGLLLSVPFGSVTESFDAFVPKWGDNIRVSGPSSSPSRYGGDRSDYGDWLARSTVRAPHEHR